MNKIYIYDFLILCILCGITLKYINYNIYKLLAGLIWGTFILSSVLANYNYTLYSIAIIIIGSCATAIYILLKIPVLKSIKIIFWLLYIVSTIVLGSVVLSKKLVFNNMYNEGPTGKKGKEGTIGKRGERYYLKTYPEQCYNYIILEVEKYLIKNKSINELITNASDLSKTEYLLKNLYFKNLIKKVCLSKTFGDYIRNIQNSSDCKLNSDENHDSNTCIYDDNLTKRVFYDTQPPTNCEKSKTKSKKDETEENERYIKIYRALNEVVIKWVEHILTNTDSDTKLDNGLSEYDHKSRFGHKFLGDYFMTEQDLSKTILDKIKNQEISLLDITENKPYNWIKKIK